MVRSNVMARQTWIARVISGIKRDIVFMLVSVVGRCWRSLCFCVYICSFLKLPDCFIVVSFAFCKSIKFLT